MRTFLFLFLLLPLLHSCKKLKCRPQKHEFLFQSGQQIDTVRSAFTDERFEYYNYQLKEGSNLVFSYRYQFEDCPDIADDEGLRTILFEVPATATQFKVEGSAALQQSKTLLVLSCECRPALPVFFKKGFIEGAKISSDKWRVKASLTAPWDTAATISFDKDFIKR